ncbi:MAG: hypothetical protein MI974_02120 [Chitinophagales bacterium]|nr:hypothetical protein [Chitinophagales bacterium]
MSDLRHCHPLENAGVSRIGRLIHALQPKTFRIDERSMQDMIVEAHRFAKTLRFFNESDQHVEGKYWDKFWEIEILTYLAVLSAKDTDEILRKYQELKDEYESAGKTKPAPGTKKKNTDNPYAALLLNLQQLAVSIEEAYLQLVRINHPLQSLLLNRIRKENCCDFEELEGALELLIKYHKGADNNLTIDDYRIFFTEDKRWGIKGRIEYDAIAAQPSFNLEKLDEIFNSFFNTWLILKQAAQNGFDKELARMELPEDVEYRIVQPHVVLFLVFLKLFQYAQDSLNELGEKHLDYYYEEVLGLKRREAIPDETFLIFELAKDFDQYLVKKGTSFLAGKDANGRPLWFEAIEDWVMRSAKVADIKTTWIDKNCGGILANPDVKKVYENGAEKPNESAISWRSMGDNQHLPDGEVGFAIASPQLILREGKRTIDIELKLCNEIADPSELQESYFKVFLSSEEEWVEPISAASQPSALEQGVFSMIFQSDSIHLKVVLERDAPSIDKLGEALAEEARFDTRWPIIKLLIRPDLRLPCPFNEGPALTTVDVYEIFRALIVKEVTIKVEAEGIRENLIIQSDKGKFDGTQKVFPFGSSPEVGNRFYIGSTEIFQKALDSLVVNFEWLAAPASFKDYYKEYMAVDSGEYATPNPQVLIDFIDRADGQKILLTQVLREGILPDVNTPIKLKINDKSLNAIAPAGLAINSIPTGISFVVDNSDPEIYLLDISGTGITNLGADNLDIEISTADTEDYELLKIDLQNPGPIPAYLEVVLFPRELFFKDFADVELIRYKVTNVYGEVLSGVTFNNTTFPLNQGFYEISQTSLPSSSISIEKSDYIPVTINNPNNFSQFEAVLHRGSYDVDNSSNTFSNAISGFVKDSRIIPNAIQDVMVFALNGTTILAITKTRTDGSYSFPEITGADKLEFYYKDREDTEAHSISITASSTDEIDVFLSPKLIERNAPAGNVNIQGTIGVAGGGTLGNVDLEINNATPSPVGSTFNRTNILPDAELKFSGNGYQDIALTVDGFTNFDVLMLPDMGSITPTLGVLGPSEIELEFINTNPTDNDITNGFLTIVPSAGTLGTFAGKKIKIIGFPAGNTITISISYSGFESISSFSADDQSKIQIRLKPEIYAENTGVTNQVKGRVVHLDGSPFSDAKVIVANNGHHYEAITNTQGSFTVDLPTNPPTTAYKIKAIYESVVGKYEITVPPNNPSVQGKDVTLMLGHITKSRPPKTKIRGSVKSTNGQLIRDVKITNGIGNESLSDNNGEFEIGYSTSLEFFHPSFEFLKVENIIDNSEIDVRLTPLNGKGFYVMEGMVTDIFEGALDNVKATMEWAGENYELGVSSANGFYRIAIPEESSMPSKINFYRASFKTTKIDFPPTSTQSGIRTLSLLDVRLRNDQVEYVPLIENGTMKEAFNVKINALNLVRDIRTQNFDCYSPTLKRGFIRFTLEQDDFMHDVYPKMLTWYSLYAAGEIPLIDLNGDGDPDKYEESSPPPIPNPPYAPATNNISIDYTSTQVITGDENNGIDDFFHLLPCNGYKEINIETFEHCFPLIYHYLPDDTNVEIILQGGNYIYDPNPYANGNLYIGIENLQPGGTLSLLFTVLAGSEKEPEALAPDIYWSYLSADNNWLLFPTGKILKDTTNGLTRTGLIQFQIPTNAVKENTMLNADYYWLRAAALPITKGGANARVQALPSLTGITAQVIQAQFVNRDNELGHLAQPLPAGTISKLAEGNIAVKKIEQPLDSFGGRLPESIGSDFIRRISERLRHKDRAITVWDYERLLLEKFNRIALAKCIQHTRYRPANKASERAPGYVTVAVIPDLAVRKGEPWAEPRFTQGDLDEMQKYLTGHTNLFVAYGDKEEAHLQLVNPLYERVDILVKVAFKPGVDEAYAKQQLQEALTYYISPWLVDIAQPPVFGRIIEKSAILQFIEEQAYVDYVDIDNVTIDENDNILASEDFLIRKSLTDLAGRPIVMHCEGTVEVNMGGNIVSELVKDAIVVKSKLYDGKICLGTERSILVAGNIVVGSTKDVISLPLLPFKINDTGMNGTGGAAESGFVFSLSQETSTRGKASAKKTTTDAKHANKAKSSVRSKQKSTATRTGKAATTKKTTSGRTRKKASSSTRKRKTTTSAKKDNSKK